MNLLLTNDDGYNAQGITVLAEHLSKKHNVFLVGPDRNRSAVSNHVTMFGNLSLEKVSERVWKSEGYPADCAAIGLLSDLTGVKIDALVSGINCGANMGSDIIFSGTCAAARQAVLSGIPAVAFSLDPIDWSKAQKEGFKFDALAEFAVNNLESLISLCILDRPRMFVNVNGASLDSYKGVKFADSLCSRTYKDTLKIVNQDGKMHTEYVFGDSNTLPEDNSDFDIVQKGYIAVARVLVDPVCQKIVDDITFKL